jgi:hypothetical protein
MNPKNYTSQELEEMTHDEYCQMVEEERSAKAMAVEDSCPACRPAHVPSAPKTQEINAHFINTLAKRIGDCLSEVSTCIGYKPWESTPESLKLANAKFQELVYWSDELRRASADLRDAVITSGDLPF